VLEKIISSASNVVENLDAVFEIDKESRILANQLIAS
jgi:hypothetical protein